VSDLPDDFPVDDPFRGTGLPILDQVVQAETRYRAIEELPIEEALRAVGGLDEDDLRVMIAARLYTQRLHFSIDGGDITFDRGHLRPDHEE
jgi:hypothetical protein